MLHCANATTPWSLKPTHTPPNQKINQQLKGFLYNNGSAAACDVRVRAVNAPGVIELWPEWGPTSAYEKFFNPKQVWRVFVSVVVRACGRPIIY